MDSVDGVELLLDVGLDRRVKGSAEVEIGVGDGQWSRRKVLLLRHSPSPQEIARAIASLRRQVDGLLFVVPHAGRALDSAAGKDFRVAYAAVEDAVVSFQGEVRRSAANEPSTSMRPGRTSWTRLAMLRLFALSPVEPLTQSEIARRLGVSHVAVGKQLPLAGGLVERISAGWHATDRAACWDRFMADYPGPRGLKTYWAATEEIATQLDGLERLASKRGGELPAVSGDLAAGFYAPWRRPSRVVVYLAEQPVLDELGFASVRLADATLELRTPQDPTVLTMSRQLPTIWRSRPRRYADPLITAWDLRRSPGGDVDSAVDQLRAQALRKPLWA